MCRPKINHTRKKAKTEGEAKQNHPAIIYSYIHFQKNILF